MMIRNVAKQELDEAEAGKSTGIAILSFISVVTLIFYFFVKNALGVIRVRFHCFDGNNIIKSILGVRPGSCGKGVGA